jgi:hypothetical protein
MGREVSGEQTIGTKRLVGFLKIPPLGRILGNLGWATLPTHYHTALFQAV